MVSTPTGRPPGRPQLPLRDDPNRYAIALMHAMMLGGASGRRASLIAVLFSDACREAPPPTPSNYFGVPPGLVAVSFEKIVRRGAPVSLRGRAETIRKNRRLSDRDKEWLFHMAAAFSVCLNGVNPYTAKLVVRHLAARASETEFAENVLLPMIAAAK